MTGSGSMKAVEEISAPESKFTGPYYEATSAHQNRNSNMHVLKLRPHQECLNQPNVVHFFNAPVYETRICTSLSISENEVML